jgi:pyridoxal phosphate enzyme (YggS family)
MDFEALPSNLERVRDEITRIQDREGVRGDVLIVAVTKGHPAAAITAASAAGLNAVGENRVQEALGKQAAVGALSVDWHLIGHVQTNKAKYVPGRFAMLHSLDSVRLADALQNALERRGGEGESLPVLVQVNAAREAQKSGCDPDEVVELANHVDGLSRLHLRGLMTMAPFTEDETVQREVFASVRKLREELASGGLEVPELSMGMSGDYPAAIAEGATILRLGTVLFGERPK